MQIATGITDVVRLHGDRLHSLVGQRIDWSRVIWFEDADSCGVHGASPVVLGIAGQALELWSVYVAEFGFTWDALNLAWPPFYWIGRPDEQSRWVAGVDEALVVAEGRVITGVRLLVVDESLCGGIEFALGGSRLFVGTGADELVIAGAPPGWAREWVALG